MRNKAKFILYKNSNVD